MITYLLALLILGCYCDEKVPLVQTPLGAISGHYLFSQSGRKFAAFEGIPYAVPPIAERRFEEAEPIGPWYGVWNATAPTLCAQTNMMQLNTTAGDEDCLHINVYVPRTTLNSKDSLDVIVHIHGGAYMYGAGHFYSRPSLLMDREVIFVTFNYRLGIFGFLSTEDVVVPGNNGLKDQVVALQWVKNNIASFGGNPNSVTLTGLSAGGSSVHLHYFSQRSEGLFHRGFSQSGFALNPWSVTEEPLNKAKKLADLLGCPTDGTRKMVDCLKQRPFKQLLAQLSAFFEYHFLPCIPFGPIVEKKGSKPFLRADPYYLISKGQVQDLPWLSSVTSHEGTFPIFYIMKDLDTLDKKWEELAPYVLDYNYTQPKTSWSSVAKKIREHYLGDSKFTKENILKVIQIFTDRFFHTDAEASAKLQAKVNKSPVYFYSLNYPGDNNEMKTVGHGADARYFFGPGALNPLPLTPNELKMSNLLLDVLVNFAKTGRVVMEEIEWKPTGSDQLTYLNINGFEPGDITLKTVEEFAPAKFWEGLKFAEGRNLIKKKDEL